METFSRILEPGQNCWRIEHAGRLALIIDAADYFKAVKEAILLAHHSVYLIGWDFDTRIRFEPDNQILDGPNALGPFLRWLDRNRPDLDVHGLKWDLGFLQTLARGTTPLNFLAWTTSKRIHFRLDSAHPKTATHHQKVIVVDDCLAFCGGIDMTAKRWDTRAHADEDPRRRRPSGALYGPWHDASVVVDGKVAGALGELARERWERATGERLQPPPESPAIWPSSVKSTFREIDVAIARTLPEYRDRQEIREIEAFYLDAVAAAQRTIYCESQYFASRRIAEAILRRLEEENGPEIVIINPESAEGFLESAAMDTARCLLLKLIHKADRHKRFRIYTPVTDAGTPIYVHAKVLIVDDCLLRVGSSNLNNRSMGLDTECDLVIEAPDDEDTGSQVRRTIAGIRNDLIGEHLSVTPRDVGKQIGKDASLIKAIEALRGSGRSLVPYEPETPTGAEKVLAENELLDPEQPPSWSNTVRKLITRQGWPLR